MRKLAELLERAEAATAQGGRAVSYEPLGVVWIAPGAVKRSVRGGGDASGDAGSAARMSFHEVRPRFRGDDKRGGDKGGARGDG